MTNEEKAEQIADNNKDYYPAVGGGFPVDSYDECEKSALAMAEWKDQQLENAWLLFKHFATFHHPRKDSDECVMTKWQFFDAIQHNTVDEVIKLIS